MECKVSIESSSRLILKNKIGFNKNKMNNEEIRQKIFLQYNNFVSVSIRLLNAKKSGIPLNESGSKHFTGQNTLGIICFV